MAIHPSATAFSSLVESYFGEGTCLPLPGADAGNPVTGAVGHSGYQTFKENLRARLKRLARAYGPPDRSRETILTRLRDTTGRRWQGPYAEIVAASYFVTPRHASATFLTDPPTLDVDLAKERTYCAEMGRAAANVDGHFARGDIYFDVKVLKDNLAEVLDGVFAAVRTIPGRETLRLGADHNHDTYYDDVVSVRDDLIAELTGHFDPSKRPVGLASRVLPGFIFRATWGPGTPITEHGYNPERHASQLHLDVFGHMDKFVRDRPFVLVYVIFPWFNNVINDFGDANRRFYRSLARRVFCQYRYSTRPASTYASKFSGTQSLWDLSQDIAAIAFLEDKSILGNTATKSKVHAFWYLNPNARNPISESRFDDILSLDLEHERREDFAHDNY